ncbi:MAG: acyl-CoA thioesterase [Deltaproteobacteria bacterium]|nr:acyl-CoA thioesterase [Deltaproteobacteria bacterium]
MTEGVLPSHTNALGTIFGGVVMSWIDIAGAIAAKRFARSAVVTVAIDYMHFIAPIRLGDTVLLHAAVTWAGKTSMETEVTVEAENSITGERRRSTLAYLTYVAVDNKGKPRKVPPLVPRDKQEKAKFEAAEKRRAQRLKWRSA